MARRRIASAAERAGRDPAAIRLVAVTKGVEAERVSAAIEAGITDVGENRVQEAAAKREAVHADARWHLIGHLQTNKATRAAEIFDVVHSIDSGRVAGALSAHHRPHRGPLRVLIEVELTEIPGRTGMAPDAVESLLRAITRMDGLAIEGLMTIAPPVNDPAGAAPYFRRLRELRDELTDSLMLPLPELSMGMSDDFEVAIGEGATMVRIGRAIFGERG